MGAKIAGAGTSFVTVEGVDELGAFDHTVIPDRIEAGTLLIAGAITGGEVVVEGARVEHLDAFLVKLEEAGVTIDRGSRSVTIRPGTCCRATDVRTSPHPGFPTDLQAQFMALMTMAEGRSMITETIFENRFMHVQELVRMGADIRVDGKTALVRGVPRLSGAPVMATDLRASVCLVLAALAAQNTSEVSRVYHLDRGYERIEEKLSGLGARIERVR